ncbi:hypothetical protein [Streptomyces vietnamensis]|uniref:hypothetical protein n=1 Tax=Streptomyces vietnamensis TaxID=362257 RepID=UPI00131BB01C|nr:hypothetical protein [Streptomyces vietnamensis]
MDARRNEPVAERASVLASREELRDHPSDDPVHPPAERPGTSGSRRSPEQGEERSSDR